MSDTLLQPSADPPAPPLIAPLAPFLARVAFQASVDLAALLAALPARWAIYLLTDEHDRPVQLLCVKNLRASIKRRLGDEAADAPSRRIDYRALVRFIQYRRVDSAFEADWLYYQAARAFFPQTYQALLGFRPAWFLHLNPDTAFPRYIKTTSLAVGTGVLFGPIDDKHAAARLVQTLEDGFDLCRYYSILVQAPHGLACAYKEMGKCPAPCDGSISMDSYRRQVRLSLAALIDPADAVRQHTRRMQQAATELRFEIAGKIKAYVDQLSELGKGHYRHARELSHFRYVSLQPGPRPGTARVYLVTPDRADELLNLIDTAPLRVTEVLQAILLAANLPTPPADATTRAERIGIVSHHLFSPKNLPGVFVPLDSIDEKSFLKAWRELQKQKPAEVSEGEGVLKELQTL